jgi:hypothetical protein
MKVHGTITTLEEFDKMIDSIRMRRAFTQGNGLPFRQEFYRGQLNSTWLIKPGLSRGLKIQEQVIEAENKIIDLFKSEVASRNCLHKIFLHKEPRGHQNDWAWLMQGQHYGIPTRMLDWTLKPEVGLYFAVDNPNMDNVDAQFLVMYYPLFDIKTESYEHHQYYDIHTKDITDTWFMNPSFYDERDDDTIGETRRARQHGKFSMQPYEQSLLGLEEQPAFMRSWTETFEPVIEKYIIPAQFKPQLRLDMIARGWHGEYLYANDDVVMNEIRDECKQLLSEIVKNGS